MPGCTESKVDDCTTSVEAKVEKGHPTGSKCISEWLESYWMKGQSHDRNLVLHHQRYASLLIPSSGLSTHFILPFSQKECFLIIPKQCNQSHHSWFCQRYKQKTRTAAQEWKIPFYSEPQAIAAIFALSVLTQSHSLRNIIYLYERFLLFLEGHSSYTVPAPEPSCTVAQSQCAQSGQMFPPDYCKLPFEQQTSLAHSGNLSVYCVDENIVKNKVLLLIGNLAVIWQPYWVKNVTCVVAIV